MKFTTITLNNFGRFRGMRVFPITTTKEQNVILVKAENDRGKTTLFNAINYALYGSGNRIKISDWINLYEAEKSDGETSIEIVFEDDGSEYRIVRTHKFLQTPRGDDIRLEPNNNELQIYINGTPLSSKDEDSRQDWIGKFLPQNASQFCFFDGEMIQQYMTKTEPGKSSAVRKAIETALGITELRHASEDLKKIHERIFESREETLLRAESKDKILLGKSDQLKTQLKNLADQKINHENEIENTKKIIRNCDNMLVKYKEIVTDVTNRKNYEGKKQDGETAKIAIQDDIRKQRGSVALILLEPLLNEIYKSKENPPSFNIFESDTAKKLILKIQEKETRHCVCGTEINNEIIEILKNKQIDVHSTNESKVKQLAESILIDFRPASKRDIYVKSIQELSDVEQGILEWEDRIKKIGYKIGKTTKDVDTLAIKHNETRTEAETAKIKHENEIKQIDKEMIDKKKKRDKITNDFYKTETASEDLKTHRKIITFSNVVLDAIDRVTEKFVMQRVGDITKHASDFFIRTTNNPKLYKALNITEDFQMEITRVDNVTLPSYKYSPSAGASQIVATSLIAGLNKFTARDAPIVIDTPLGRLDPTHRKNLIRNYSQMGKQILIFYQSGELGRDDMKYFGGSVASEWIIEEDPNDAAASIIKIEEDHL